MAAQAAGEGRFLGGRPPYGYRLADAGPHPNPGKAASGQRLHRLEPDPQAAPVVVRSGGQAHEPLVDLELFEAVQERFRRGPHRTGGRKPRTTLHPYALKGLVHCGLYGRRTESTLRCVRLNATLRP
jgi:hypothetical protein